MWLWDTLARGVVKAVLFIIAVGFVWVVVDVITAARIKRRVNERID